MAAVEGQNGFLKNVQSFVLLVGIVFVSFLFLRLELYAINYNTYRVLKGNKINSEFKYKTFN